MNPVLTFVTTLVCGLQVFRESERLLCQTQRHDPHVVRARFLRHPGSPEVVGAIQTPTLAGHPRPVRQRRHPRCGKSTGLLLVARRFDKFFRDLSVNYCRHSKVPCGISCFNEFHLNHDGIMECWNLHGLEYVPARLACSAHRTQKMCTPGSQTYRAWCCRLFERARDYAGSGGSVITTLMTFVMGFYVSLIVTRWWEQYRLLPWPDTLALFVSAAIVGQVSRRPRAQGP
ncbi:chloride channel activity protein [Homalodisca vitripennis]|nr:chloride channel activity protein [Homalodisca vitripennis]